MRLEAVRSRLRDGSGSRLKAIVQDCGYASLNTFAKAFKRRYGISATEYRDQQRAAGGGARAVG